jgi:hypothetical protein
MKRVKVDTAAAPLEPDGPVLERRMYTVTLGNHRQLHFASKRQALAFQADATRYLTDTLMTGNLLLAEAFTAYRMAWPYFSANDTTLMRQVRDAEDALDRAARVNSPNAVYFRWRALGTALDSIWHMANELVKVYSEKSQAVPKHQAAVLATRCRELAEELKQYGSDTERC